MASPVSFARGIPSADLLPIAEFGECARAVVARDGAAILNYGPPGGYAPLRAWIAARHDVAPERVLVTTGSLQGFNFVTRHFAAAHARVFVEAPCYDRSLGILKRLGADVESIPLGEDGMDVDVLADALERASGPAVVYTIPTFQNPSGRTLSRESRNRLLDVARDREAVVLEDDPYGLLRFEGETLPTLFELSAGTTLFLTSFSKTVAPGIRVGYLVVPDELVAPMEGFVLENYVSPAIFVQAALHEFIERGHFEPNVDRIRLALRARRDAMIAALEREFPEGSRWSEPEGGYFLWIDLPTGVDADDVLARATEAGVTFVKGADFYMGAGGEQALRLAFSFASVAEIEDGISCLGGLVRESVAVPA